jgi:hypothetical protein
MNFKKGNSVSSHVSSDASLSLLFGISAKKRFYFCDVLTAEKGMLAHMTNTLSFLSNFQSAYLVGRAMVMRLLCYISLNLYISDKVQGVV